MNRGTMQETIGVILAELKEQGAKLVEKTALDLNLNTQGFADEVLGLSDSCREIIDSVAEEAKEVLGVNLPNYLCNFKFYSNSEDKVVTVKVYVRTKKAVIPAIKAESILKVDEHIVSNIVDKIFEGYKEVLFAQFIGDNLKEANDYIAGILAEAEIPYTVAFTIDGTNKAFTSLTDSGIIFNLTFDEGLDLGNNCILNVFDEYDEYTKNLARDKFVKQMKKIQTSLQLVKAPITLINDICHNKSRRKIESIVKECCDKDIVKLKKDGVGYFFKETEDARIVSIIELKDDAYTVILAPTDIKTMTKVDLDVLAEIENEKAKLAEETEKVAVAE